MNDTITDRSKKILRVLANSEALSRVAIEQAINETRINTIRELDRLVELGYVSVSGQARATVYAITKAARTIVIWDIKEYLAQEPNQRHARYTRIEPALFNSLRSIIEPTSLSVVINATIAKRRDSKDSFTAQKERERFVIELSWKSSKIEGNTYTLLDTERLINEAVEAPGHNHAEAIMILNHKKAFDYIWNHQETFRTLTVSKIEEIHQLLVADLDVPDGIRSAPVGITGTIYMPPAGKNEISSYLHGIVDVINELKSPIEKAMACLVLLPYLQPFIDGNKHTSRLTANAVLLAGGYPPLSYRDIDEQAYKGALILFYEQGSLANFHQLYLEQLEDSATSYFFPTKGPKDQ